jgi:hypothetical protein
MLLSLPFLSHPFSTDLKNYDIPARHAIAIYKSHPRFPGVSLIHIDIVRRSNATTGTSHPVRFLQDVQRCRMHRDAGYNNIRSRYIHLCENSRGASIPFMSLYTLY